MLTLHNVILLIIDIQGNLAHSMHEKEALFKNLQKLIKGAQILEIPILWTEQNPEGLGATIPEVGHLLSQIQPIPKRSFSCCGEERFMQEFKELNGKQVLLAGIETHICIYQTAIDLLDLGYEVQIVADAVSSRAAENKKIGLEKMKHKGASITSTETALFELLKVAEGAKFKEILKIVR